MLLVDARAGFVEEVGERLAAREDVDRVVPLDRPGNMDYAVVVTAGEAVVMELLTEDLPLTPGVDDARRAEAGDPVLEELGGGDIAGS